MADSCVVVAPMDALLETCLRTRPLKLENFLSRKRRITNHDVFVCKSGSIETRPGVLNSLQLTQTTFCSASPPALFLQSMCLKLNPNRTVFVFQCNTGRPDRATDLQRASNKQSQ